MPGWKAINETPLQQSGARSLAVDAADDTAHAADAVMPSLDELKAKYLGAARGDAAPAAIRQEDTAANAADTTLVELESGPLKKTVAVSKSKKKVIWSQG